MQSSQEKKYITKNSLGERIIFLISQPRAGSTMLQRILAGHPEIYTTAEPWIMLHPIYALRYKGYSAEYNSNVARDALKDFLNAINEEEDIYIEAIRKMTLHLYGRAIEKSGKVFFLDKTPRYYFIIPELYRIFPEAKFIILFRNPLSVLISILDTWVKGNWQMLSHYKYDLLRAPKLLLNGIELLKHRAIVVHYEDIVGNPEQALNRLCEKLKIDFHSKMIEYGNTPDLKGRMGDKTGIYKHTRPVIDYVDKWKYRLGIYQYWILANVYLSFLAQDTINRMGYSFQKLQNELLSICPDEREPDEKILKDLLGPLGLYHVKTSCIKDIRNKMSIYKMNQEGEELFNSGDIEGSLNLFQKIVKIAPHYAISHNNLGVLFWNQGDFDRAIEHFIKALEIDPENIDVILNLGEIYKGLNKYQEAKTVYMYYLNNYPYNNEVALALKSIEDCVKGAEKT